MPSYQMRDSHAPKTLSVTRKQSCKKPKIRDDVSELQRAFLDNFKTLKEDMEALEVTNILKEKKILDEPSHAKIVNVKERRLRVDALIKALYKKMSQMADAISRELKNALIQSGQGAIVEQIQETVVPFELAVNESKQLLNDFYEKKEAIMSEVEPLKVIDMIAVHRGLSLDEHEEILLAKSRQDRVYILCTHLHSLLEDQAWMILKPIKDEYPRFFSFSGQDQSADVSRMLGATASEKVPSPNESQHTDLRINLLPSEKTSTPIMDSSEHDHPMMKIKEIEKKIVESVSANPETYSNVERTMFEECTMALQNLSFSSIKINLSAPSDISVEQLMAFCKDGRAKRLVLSLLDEDSRENLMKLDSKKALLEIYVDKEQRFLDTIRLIGEDCLCTLTSESIERNYDYVVERIEGLEISFIDNVLESGILAQEQASQLATIKKSAEGKGRREKLVKFLQNKTTCQAALCMLENDILMRCGGIETILRIQQTKTCKVTESMHGPCHRTSSITGSDIEEHAAFLEEEIEPRWFLNILQTRKDQRAKELVKEIQDSMSRKQRIVPFMEFLHKEEDLSWFAKVLNEEDKEYILQELQQFKRKDFSCFQFLKIAFMSAYDAIVEDLEPLELERYLSYPVRQQIEFDSLRIINTREKRASTFIKQVIHCDRIRESLDAMRYFYCDLVTTVQEISERGSACDKYRCPRLRQCLSKSPVCIFRTEIDLFEEDTDISEITTNEMSLSDRKMKIMAETGFVQAKVIKFVENEPWSLSGRRNTCIGIIGSESRCKRSLLDAMYDRIQTNVETAQVVVETDVEKFSTYSEARNVILWDLPEIGTDQIPCETYLKKIDYKRYDYFALLVQHTDSLQRYMAVVKEIANLHRKIVLICTDKGKHRVPTMKYEPVAHCSNAANDTEKRAVEEIRKTFETSLKESGFGVAFCLINEDAVLNDNYDFEKLFSMLMQEISS